MFVGIDALPQEGQVYVKQGILAASFEYPTGGKEAIDTALEILQRQDGAEGNHAVVARLHEGEYRQGRRSAEGRIGIVLVLDSCKLEYDTRRRRGDS